MPNLRDHNVFRYILGAVLLSFVLKNELTPDGHAETRRKGKANQSWRYGAEEWLESKKLEMNKDEATGLKYMYESRRWKKQISVMTNCNVFTVLPHLPAHPLLMSISSTPTV